MAQADYIVANGTGAAVRSDLNGQLAAIVSNNSGATEPATMYAYQWWADTTTGLLKLRNGANSAWVSLFELDGTFIASDISLGAGTVGAPSLFFTGDSDTGLFSPGADTLALVTAGTNRLHVTSAGLVGIGTTSASTILHVASTAPYIRIQDTDSSTGVTAQGGFEMYDSDGDRLFYLANESSSSSDVSLFNIAGGALKFGTSGSERGQFDSSGRLLVGTSTSATGGQATQYARLQVNGNTSGNPGVIALGSALNTASVISGSSLGYLTFADKQAGEYAWVGGECDGTPGTNDYPGRLVFSTTADGASSPTEQFRISNNGFITAYQVYNFTTASAANVFVESGGGLRRSTSSIKYKTDIETLQDNYADQILSIRPVWYRSTCESDCPEHSYWGFIAEEVAIIDKRLVQWKTKEITYDEKGSAVETPCEPEPDGVAYDRFVPHLLNLIKRQKEQIEAMEARLSALETE
jgi:hypothetical protein